MTEARCLHLNRVSGVMQRDLSRPAGENSLYSVELTTHICESCGQVELYIATPTGKSALGCCPRAKSSSFSPAGMLFLNVPNCRRASSVHMRRQHARLPPRHPDARRFVSQSAALVN